MTKDKIYEALRAQGLSATMIADALQVSPQFVINVIARGHGSRRVAEAISKLLEVPLVKAFPYYASNHSQHYRTNQRQRQVAMLSGRFSAIA